MKKEELLNLAKEFDIKGNPTEAKLIDSGHINNAYLVKYDTGNDSILQYVNTNVFPNITELITLFIFIKIFLLFVFLFITFYIFQIEIFIFFLTKNIFIIRILILIIIIKIKFYINFFFIFFFRQIFVYIFLFYILFPLHKYLQIFLC